MGGGLRLEHARKKALLYNLNVSNQKRGGSQDLCGTVFQFQCSGLWRGLSAGGFPRLARGSVGLWSLGAFIQLDDAGVRNLPAEGLHFTLLLVAFFEKDGLSRVGRQIAGRGQDDVPGAVRDLDATS